MQMGVTVRDKITRFEGVVTVRTQYITGCAQVLVQQKPKAEGEFVSGHWFDEHRLEVINAVPLMINPNPGKGPDIEAPNR